MAHSGRPAQGGEAGAPHLFIDSVIDYAILELDVNGIVSSWNPGAERLKGYTADEIIGQHFSKFYVEADRIAGLPEKLLREAREKGRVEHTGWRVRKSGERFWGDIVISAVRDENGDLLGYAKVTRDLTERKEAEEREHELTANLERANRLKSEFLSNMSHEVRTPLNGIIGMLSLLLETPLTESQRDLVETAASSSNSLLRIVNDILDFSKVEAGKLELESLPFSVATVVQEVRDLFEPQAQAKAIRIRSMIDADLPDQLMGDPGRLRQILANLIGNAIKFTSEGLISVAVQVEDDLDDEMKVAFEVSDTGIGVSPEEAKRLFSAFSQADVSTTRRYGGTGLGLTISAQLVSLMGGKLDLSSEEGIGSTFKFTVPMPVPARSQIERETQPGHTQPQIEERRPVQDRGRLLIAEDNPVNQKVARLFVERDGYEVVVVENGKQVLEALQREPFDAVLMDCHMPEMDGYEAARCIRRLPGPESRIPIIAATASALLTERQKCFDAGMDDFISKPISHQELHAVLDRWVTKADRADSVPPQLDVLRSDVGDTWAELVSAYVASSRSQMELVRKGLAEGDMKTAAEGLHALRGGSTVVGADDVAEVAERMEAALVGERCDDAIAEVDLITDLHAAALSRLMLKSQ